MSVSPPNLTAPSTSDSAGARPSRAEHHAARAFGPELHALVAAERLLDGEVRIARRALRVTEGAEPSWRAVAAAALAIAAQRAKHVHVDLLRVDIDSLDDAPRLPADRNAWVDEVASLAAVRVADAAEAASGDAPAVADERGHDATLLVLHRGEEEGVPFARLAMLRAWRDESQVVSYVRRTRRGRSADAPRWAEALASAYFDQGAGGSANPQVRAAVDALARQLLILTGGPGTGKTYTVRAMLIALWVHARLAARATSGAPTGPPSVLLVAPTGKAAQRMRESIAAGLDEAMMRVRPVLASPEVLGQHPQEALDELKRWLETLPASTIHRALGVLPNDPTRFRRGPESPLAADVVIVDEVSMVDLALMASLTRALRADARLILAGDRRQLVSVEAGSVLADLCAASRAAAGTGADAFVVELTAARRFEAQSAIGRFAQACAALDAEDPAVRPSVEACVAILAAAGPEARTVDVPTPIEGLQRAIRAAGDDAAAARSIPDGAPRVERAPELVVAPFAGAAGVADEVLDAIACDWLGLVDLVQRGRVHASPQHADAATALRVEPTSEVAHRVAIAWLERLRVLSPHRKGAGGVAALNTAIHARMRDLVRAGGPWAGLRVHAALDGGWAGRPVMVTRNDSALGRFNGDTGVLVLRQDDEGVPRLRAVFAGAGDALVYHPVSLLPEHETCFAMTIHKSQGSEFDHAVVVVPERPSRIVTRELIYTAVTRARRRITVVGDPTGPAFHNGLATTIRRATGLAARLLHAEPVESP